VERTFLRRKGNMLKLFESADIGSMHLKNRVFVCPMAAPSDIDGGVSARVTRYFEEMAKGGAGLILCQLGITSSFNDPMCPLLDCDCGSISFTGNKLPRLGALIDRVHYQGAKFCAQLAPGSGRVSADTSKPIYSSSATKAFWNPNVTCTPYTANDIKVLVESAAAIAAIVKAAGADAIEIHGSGGYLLDQFISPLWNTRTDEYGGDLKGRMKLPLEMVDAIRSVVGNDFPIIVKMTITHGIPDGTDVAEGIEAAKMYEAAGVNALQPEEGCYETWYLAHNTVYEKPGFELDLIGAVKDVVSIPIMGQGKLMDPAVAENALKDGKLDFIGLGHQMLADPEWPKKVKENRTYDIRPCIGCNECLYSIFSGALTRCAVNPLCLRDEEFSLTPAKEKKSILVVGGGPGGLTAAITAAERGFHAELWEKTNELGGNLISAGAPAFKQDVGKYVNYLKNKAYRTGVVIKLMKDASPKEIITANFDKVILATGSKPIVPRIPGIDGPNVHIFDEVLSVKAKTGAKTAIIGGGHVGCETAIHLKQIGAAEVTIIEMLDDILAVTELSLNMLMKLRALIAENGINVIAGARVTEILKDGVAYEKNGEPSKLDCDTVVIAAGLKADNPLEKALEGEVKELAVIGDAVKARKVVSAVHEGYHAVRVFG
jgi:2-enoate reductase